MSEIRAHPKDYLCYRCKTGRCPECHSKLEVKKGEFPGRTKCEKCEREWEQQQKDNISMKKGVESHIKNLQEICQTENVGILAANRIFLDKIEKAEKKRTVQWILLFLLILVITAAIKLLFK